jgi:Zn-dependent protease
MDIFSFPTIVTKILVLLISFPVHELAHAWTANYFGDETPKSQGRLTLNPLAHLDVAGSFIFLVSYFGWAKSVPVNPYYLKKRSRYAYLLVSLAGPISNLILAIIVSIPFRLGLVDYSNQFISQILYYFLLFNLILAIFNLIPLSPLDGGKIFSQLLPANLQDGFARIDQYGPILLMLLIFVLPMIGFDPLGAIINPILGGLFSFLTGA